MKAWILRISAVLLLAAVFHVLTLAAFPTLVMLALKRSTEKAGHPMNTLIHAPRVTADSKRVVRPSPDLLYSACGFDVSEKPLKIIAPVPDTYWSVSFFASNTDNFFVLNDRQARSKRVEILLVGPGASPPKPGRARVIVSPTDQGVIIFRMLIMDEDKISDLVRVQRQATCKPALH